jgi:hypothetical protein
LKTTLELEHPLLPDGQRFARQRPRNSFVFIVDLSFQVATYVETTLFCEGSKHQAKQKTAAIRIPKSKNRVNRDVVGID